MTIKEISQKAVLGGAVLAIMINPSIENEIIKDHNYEQYHNPSAYEEKVDSIEHLKKEGLRDLTSSIKDVAEGVLEDRTKREETKNRAESANPPPHSYSNSPPPTEHEIAENLRELREEATPKRNEIRALERQASRLEEIQKNKERLERMKVSSNKSPNEKNQIRSLENSIQKAHEAYKKEFHAEPEKAPKAVKDLREQAGKKERELKPTEEKITALQEQQQHRSQERSDNAQYHGIIR